MFLVMKQRKRRKKQSRLETKINFLTMRNETKILIFKYDVLNVYHQSPCNFYQNSYRPLRRQKAEFVKFH